MDRNPKKNQPFAVAASDGSVQPSRQPGRKKTAALLPGPAVPPATSERGPSTQSRSARINSAAVSSCLKCVIRDHAVEREGRGESHPLNAVS
jgi:hypothetical protein